MVIRTRDDLSDSELRKQARERFAVAQRLEAEYLRALRNLTRQIDSMVKHTADKPKALQEMLHLYAQTITPWARAVAEKMIWRIARKDETAWAQLGNKMGRALRKEIQGAPTGLFLQKFMEEQVTLITSLPLEAAQRVHRLTLEGITQGTRAEEIKLEILKTGKVTESRAKLIARTEIAGTASGLTMARAIHVGSTHYVWRTSGDTDVRPSHKKMNGAVIPYATPPEVELGKRYHAGQFPNCRCYIEPIIMEN